MAAEVLGAKNKADEYNMLQFTQIPQLLGPNGEEAEMSMQTTTSEKGVAEKSLQKI